MPRCSSPVLAVTGGIAEGKSTVLAVLAELGFRCASADEVVRELWEDVDFRDRTFRSLGFSGPFDRERLREAIASDAEIRRSLNRLVHPEVWARLRTREVEAVEVPLLVEACLTAAFPRIWVVTCGPAEQRRRLAHRLGSEERARALIGTQIRTRAKLPFGDAVIRTDRSPEDVHRHVQRLVAQDLVFGLRLRG